jgi:uncharacterized protein YndB with AHSA1/START domain
MNAALSDTAITMTRLLRAAPDAVFDALTRPELMKRWMCPEGLSVRVDEADARPGGRFSLEMRKPDGTRLPASGTYTELRAPTLLAFTWRWQPDHPAQGVETHIRIELSPRGEHTFLHMTHTGLPTEDERAGHHDGWTSALGKLARFVETGAV